MNFTLQVQNPGTNLTEKSKWQVLANTDMLGTVLIQVLGSYSQSSYYTLPTILFTHALYPITS